VKQKNSAAVRGSELFEITLFAAQDDPAQELDRADDMKSIRYQKPELSQS
jgi:hypothetical protein